MKGMDHEVWFKWYSSDWRGDVGLRLCGAEARGVWCELIMLMREGTPPGHLTLDGTPLSAADIARLTSLRVEEVERGLVELERRQIFSTTPEGVRYCRRIVREASVSGSRRSAASARWDQQSQPDSAFAYANADTKTHAKRGSGSGSRSDQESRDPTMVATTLAPTTQTELDTHTRADELKAEAQAWVSTLPSLTTRPAQDAARRAVVRVMQSGVTLAEVKALWQWATQHHFWGAQCVTPARLGDADKHGVSMWLRLTNARDGERRRAKPSEVQAGDAEAERKKRETAVWLTEHDELRRRKK